MTTDAPAWATSAIRTLKLSDQFQGQVSVLDGGTITLRVRTPGRQAVACRLGGADGRTLFCLPPNESFEVVAGSKARARVEIVELGQGRATSARNGAKRR